MRGRVNRGSPSSPRGNTQEVIHGCLHHRSCHPRPPYLDVGVEFRNGIEGGKAASGPGQLAQRGVRSDSEVEAPGRFGISVPRGAVWLIKCRVHVLDRSATQPQWKR